MNFGDYHQPVLLKEVLERLPSKLEIGFDGTLWHWGHTKAILKKRWDIKKWYGVDRDSEILEKAKARLSNFADKIEFINWSYAQLDKILWNQKVDFMLLDLGVNMEHFKDFDRWFSIKWEGELDMRFDRSSWRPLWQAIKSRDFDYLSRGFMKYGDFGPKFSKWLAKEILDQWRKNPLKTTLEFKQFLNDLGLGEKKAVIIFQALRIMVNDELRELEIFLQKFSEFLRAWGRLAIISYHSWEDRIVKNVFKDLATQGKIKISTKKVIKPTWEEIKDNKAARSAKMRIVQRI